MGAGKSTLSKAIKDALKLNGLRVLDTRFADPLYEMHGEIRFLLKSYDPENTLNYNYNVKDGNLLQLLGTEWGRNTIDSDIWVKIMIAKIKKEFSNYDCIVIDDCRFKNEFILPKLNFVGKVLTVRLECDRDIRKARCEMWRDRENHQSECDLDDWADKFDLKYDSGLNSVAAIKTDIIYEILERFPEITNKV